MEILYLIPARGGSKGIPRKNIKPLLGKPLIYYTLDCAMQLTSLDHICVSTDDPEIAQKTQEHTGLPVPFMRPAHLASDTAGGYDVFRHAVNFYRSKGIFYDVVVVLQPTSPFRLFRHVREAIALFDENVDMVTSVHRSGANPYYTLFEEDDHGFIRQSKTGQFKTRQECPAIWELNGSVYVINVESLMRENYQFSRIRKYEMEDVYSVDIDNELEWAFAEFLLEKKLVSLGH